MCSYSLESSSGWKKGGMVEYGETEGGVWEEGFGSHSEGYRGEFRSTEQAA